MLAHRTLLGSLGVLAAAAALWQAPVRAAPNRVEIATDTVWRGVVAVEGEVRVLKGATLLVQPGTTIRFSTAKSEAGEPQARLLVAGTLIAQGTADEPILFTSAGESARPGDWGGIVLDRAVARMNRLSHARVEGGIVGVAGSNSVLVIENTVLRNNVTGVYASQELIGTIMHSTISDNEVGMHYHQSSKLQIEDCRITGNRVGGIACILNSSPTIRLSLIADNGPKGIVCIQGSSPRIEGNTIRGHERGIFIELQARPVIYRNAITDNETGIWGEKMVFPTVQGNEIARNGTGIYCNYSAYMQIHGNNIRENTSFGVVVGDNMSILVDKLIPYRHMGEFYADKPPEAVILPQQTRKFVSFPPGEEGIVDARGNWWGAAATAEMAKLGDDGNISVLEDFRDKPDSFFEGNSYRRDRVAFAPWEEEPLAETGPPDKAYSGVAGKVVLGGKPVGGVRVHAFDEATGAFVGEGYAYAAPAAPDGSYRLDLPPGAYYLVAKGPLLFPHGEPGTGELFGYYGGNPVQVPPGSFANANLQVVRRAPATLAGRADGMTRVDGVVLGPEGPVAGASVHVYIDASRQFRGPDLFGPQGAVPGGTDDQGAFSIELPQGSYFLVGSKRKGGDSLGPLRPGDLHGYFDGNPVTPAPGSTTLVTLQVVEKLRETAVPATAGTGIRGRVQDPSGKAPPSGVYAFATTDPSFMIGAMPPYRSLPIGPDGSFFIELAQGGTYYVSARSGYGGPPLPGEWHGFYGEKTPRPVTVETGSVTEGLVLVIKKME